MCEQSGTGLPAVAHRKELRRGRLLRRSPLWPRPEATLRCIAGISFLLSGWFSPGLEAQASAERADRNTNPRVYADKAPFELRYDHLDGRLTLVNHKGSSVETWETGGRSTGSAPLIPLPPDRPVVVVVQNANPLLYSYDVDAAVVAPRNLRPCRDIGAQFAARGMFLGIGAIQGGQLPPANVGAAMGFPDLAGVLNGLGARGGNATTLTETSLTRGLDAIRAPVSAYIDFLETIVVLGETLDDSLAVIARLSDAAPADSLLAALQASVNLTQPDLSQPAQVPRILQARLESVQQQLAILGTLSRGIALARGTAVGEGPAANEIRRLESRIEELAPSIGSAANALQTTLLRIEQARKNTVQTFTVGPAGDYRQLTIRVEPTDDFEDILRVRQGTIDAFTKPSVSLLCELSLGLNWMDHPPQYGVRDGLLINEEAGESRATPSLLLLFSTPRFPLIGAMVGVGVGVERAPDLYAGWSFRFFDPVMINAGWIWQRERRLPAGLSVGVEVNDPFQLDNLPKRYKASMFFGISLAR